MWKVDELFVEYPKHAQNKSPVEDLNYSNIQAVSKFNVIFWGDDRPTHDWPEYHNMTLVKSLLVFGILVLIDFFFLWSQKLVLDIYIYIKKQLYIFILKGAYQDSIYFSI